MLLTMNSDMVIREIKGETILLNTDTGDYFNANETTADFLKLVDGKTKYENIVKKMSEIYEIDTAELQKDMKDLLSMLIDKKIIFVDD